MRTAIRASTAVAMSSRSRSWSYCASLRLATTANGTKGMKGEGVYSKLIPKPGINIASDKGYRVFRWRHYIWLPRRRGKPRHALARICKPAVSTLIKAAGVTSNTREFQYVAARKTRRNNTVYTGVARVSGTRAQKYLARCDTPAEAANMVVECLKGRCQRNQGSQGAAARAR